jgi:hypothetical protein
VFVDKIVAIFLVPSFLIGCMPKVGDVSTTIQPKTRPVRNITGFSQAMECMDGLFVKYEISNHQMASTAIPDSSGKLSLGVRDMLINAISKMSRNSHSFKYLDYETSASSDKTDTVQNMSEKFSQTGDVNPGLPEVYIRGSISQVNESAITANQHLGVNVTQLNAGSAEDISFSTVTLDLQLFDMATRTLIPGMSYSNMMTVSRNGLGLDVGAQIQKAGVSFEFNKNESEDSGQAVRNLVELGAIELLGKWQKVPYWSCLNIDSTNPMAKTETKAWYDGMNYQERIKFFKSGLKHFGYLKGNVNAENDPELKTAITQYQADKGLVPNGTDSFETYESLINSGASSSSITKTIPSSESNLFAGVRPMDVRIVTREKQYYKKNDFVSLNVSLSESGYLRCYYRDEEGGTVMIYPNNSQEEAMIAGNQTLTIPNPALNAFQIQIQNAGTQEFMCMASNEKLESILSNSLNVAALTPISGIVSLDQVAFETKAKTKGQSFGFAKKQIIVK